jgi:hypothetical protein
VLKRHAIRQLDQVALEQHSVFRIAAVARLTDVAVGLPAQRRAAAQAIAASSAGLKVEGRNPVSRCEILDVGSDLDHLCRELVPEDARRLDARSHAGAKNQIEVAHAATLDANQRLVRCRHGSWDLLNLQYLRSSEFIQDNCFHPAQRFADAFAAETAALRASR